MLIFCERKILLAGWCWWLVLCEREILLAECSEDEAQTVEIGAVEFSLPPPDLYYLCQPVSAFVLFMLQALGLL